MKLICMLKENIGEIFIWIQGKTVNFVQLLQKVPVKLTGNSAHGTTKKIRSQLDLNCNEKLWSQTDLNHR